MVARSLNLLDRRYNYNGRCSQICNTARSTGHPRVLKANYALVTTDAIANLRMRRLMPRNLRGRWGALNGLEEYLLVLERHSLRATWRTTFGTACSRVDASEGMDASALIDLMDGVGMGGGDMTHFSTMKSKWIRGSCQSIESDEFWIVLTIAHVTRSPFHHLENIIMSLTATTDNPLVSLVTRDAAYVFEQFLEPDFGFLFELVNTDAREIHVALAVEMNILHATDYFTRIICDTYTFPNVWLWLIPSPCTHDCANRRGLARDLLSPGDRISNPSFLNAVPPRRWCVSSETISPTCVTLAR